MKTRLADLAECGLPVFTFAGMRFPKHVWTLPRGKPRDRLSQRRGAQSTSDCYHAPRPIGTNHRIGFYLSDGMPGLRWMWCDEADATIRHTGWYADEHQDNKVRGLVFRLPHGRGFLAGCGLGEGMSATLECAVYDDAVTAANIADQLAQRAAEEERDLAIKNAQALDD